MGVRKHIPNNKHRLKFVKGIREKFVDWRREAYRGYFCLILMFA